MTFSCVPVSVPTSPFRFPDEAESALRRLAERSPSDASARHNLGTLLLRAKRYDEAAESYREALGLRPDNPVTHLHLGYA